MSNSWSGGKGDRSRVTDLKAYEENYNRIFRKEKKEENMETLYEKEALSVSLLPMAYASLILISGFILGIVIGVCI